MVNKCNDKFHPITGYEGTGGEQQCGSTRSLTTALDVGGWSTPRPGPLYPGNDPLPIVKVAGWATGPVWTGAEIFAPTGTRYPDRPARSESLYRLSCLLLNYLVYRALNVASSNSEYMGWRDTILRGYQFGEDVEGNDHDVMGSITPAVAWMYGEEARKFLARMACLLTETGIEVLPNMGQKCYPLDREFLRQATEQAYRDNW